MIDQDPLVNLLVGDDDVLAVEGLERRGAQIDVLDLAQESFGLDQIARLERMIPTNGKTNSRDQVGGEILKRKTKRQSRDPGTRQERCRGPVQIQYPESHRASSADDQHAHESSHQTRCRVFGSHPRQGPLDQMSRHLGDGPKCNQRHDRNDRVGKQGQGRIEPGRELFGHSLVERVITSWFIGLSAVCTNLYLCMRAIGASLEVMAETWAQVTEEAVKIRHTLHENPELTWQEKNTAQLIRNRLDELAIPWRTCAELGTVAHLASDAPGPHIALRADMDALPIIEQSGVPWASRNAGVMHACGHDGHTATLLAAAQWLSTHKTELAGPVSLIFQPAEEGGHGAKHMIDDGALQGIDFIFGFHNWPALPFGQALCPDGPIMCANGAFTIHVRGVGGHASQPELCRDPVLAAAAITLNLQQIVSRRMVPQEPAVVSVTQILAPSGATTIPNEAELGGSIRASSSEQRSEIEGLIAQIVADTARGYGVEAKVEHHPRYGATINHPQAAAMMRQALEAELGPDWQAKAHSPIMASEDFSYYLEAIPGAFSLIGAGGPDKSVPCHNATYDFDDRLVSVAGKLYARLAGAIVR